MTHHLITLDDYRDFLVYRQGMGRTVEIYDICVETDRRKGKGRKLIKRLLENLKDAYPDTSMVYAVTRIGNTIAHQFYEALGFRLLGRLHYFYRDSGDQLEHALVYGLDV